METPFNHNSNEILETRLRKRVLTENKDIEALEKIPTPGNTWNRKDKKRHEAKRADVIE